MNPINLCMAASVSGTVIVTNAGVNEAAAALRIVNVERRRLCDAAAAFETRTS
jgi:hypothetical protein